MEVKFILKIIFNNFIFKNILFYNIYKIIKIVILIV